MVNITARVIEKKEGLLDQEAGAEVDQHQSSLVLCTKQAWGRKGFIQCHRPSLREAIKELQAGTEALSTWRDSTH